MPRKGRFPSFAAILALSSSLSMVISPTLDFSRAISSSRSSRSRFFKAVAAPARARLRQLVSLAMVIPMRRISLQARVRYQSRTSHLSLNQHSVSGNSQKQTCLAGMELPSETETMRDYARKMSKQPNQPFQIPIPMTLGNMRENGVRTLAAWCLGRGCNHFRVLDVSGYPDDLPVPSFGPRLRRER